MKSRLLTMAGTAAALMTVTSSYAQGIKEFPAFYVPQENAAERIMQRAPLNQDKRDGLKVFGATQIDSNRSRSFVNYYENRFDLEKLNNIFTQEEADASATRDLWMINAGAYNPEDGNYYAYKVKYYTIGITYACEWLKVNPVDGKWEVITPLSNHSHDNTFLYDMAYSLSDSEMYGLIQSVKDGKACSSVGLVNLENSEVYDIHQLNDYYFAFAFDYDGKAYAVRWDYNAEGTRTGSRLDEFDANWNVTKSTELKVDGAAYMGYYQHGLDFDYTTGDIIWAATDDEGRQRMVRINPDTYATKNMGSVGFNELMIGLYVPYTTAEDREAPAKVDNLGFTADANGDNNVTINWTNPTTTWNRKALNNLTSVVIYRDAHSGTPVGTVDATGKEGQQMSFQDKGAAKGIHTYYVMAVNAKGEGVEQSVEAYVGRDVPGKVNDIQVSTADNGRSVNISWSAPTTGDSEGWFDKSIKYDIVRQPDNKTIATGLDATSYKDANIEEAQYYTYVITPVTTDGRGTPNTSDGILAGASLKVPFSTEFASAAEAARFTSFDKFGPSNLFQYTFNSAVGNGVMSMHYNYNTTNDITLSSPALNLAKGKKYRVNWTFNLCRYGDYFADAYHHFKVLGGVAPDAESMTNVLGDYEDFLSVRNYEACELVTYFESPVDGDYCIGFNILTEGIERKDDWIYVTGFSITEAPDDDLAVTSLEAPKSVSMNNDNFFDVEVYNNGDNKQSNYKVEVGVEQLNGVFVPFASTEDVPELLSHESKTVRVVGKTSSVTGVQDLAARVVLEGDGNASNDKSGLTEVYFDYGPAFNYHANNKATEYSSTNLPFEVAYTNSTSQTIYTADMLGFTDDENKIAGLAWQYSSDKDIDNIKLKVYLNTTTQSTYRDDRGRYITDGNTLVYEGIVSVEEGDDKWLCITFPESNVYTLAKDKNLVVTVFMEETACNTTFPLHFGVFNSKNADPYESDGLLHTLLARDSNAINFETYTNPMKFGELPILHVALKGDTSVESIEGDGSDLNVFIASNTAHFSGNVAFATIYDMNGRMLSNADVRGVSAMPFNLDKGVYLLKVADDARNSKVVKFVVR